MRVIDNSRKIRPFFMEVGLGKTFRTDERVFVKIANVFSDEDVSEYLDNYYEINDVEELRDNIGVLNAYCLDGCFLTHFDADDPVELVDCEIHIV
jgi:hypothetical protein